LCGFFAQRRVLSAVMVEVVYYCREMLTDLMNAWDENKSFLTLEYVSPLRSIALLL
jgi:hypothetical protein